MRRLGLTVMAAVVVLLAGCSEDPVPGGDVTPEPIASSAPTSSETPPPETSERPEGTEVELTVTGGKRSAGPEEVEVRAGEQVTFVVTADAPDELHLHGYDKTAAVQPGKPTRLKITADLPGVWELELHESGALLTELKVTG